MKFNASTEYWNPMTIKGIDGYFVDVRVDRESVPEGYKFWELADDNDGVPNRYKSGVMVNFYGTFITKGELPIEDKEHTEGFIEEDEWEIDWDTSQKLEAS